MHEPIRQRPPRQVEPIHSLDSPRSYTRAAIAAPATGATSTESDDLDGAAALVDCPSENRRH
jgi:hypothetical protein